MKKVNWNEKWKFTKDSLTVECGSVLKQGTWSDIDLPHTWNGIDGQDGGNDYYRGTCYYEKTLIKEAVSDTDAVYLEFEGANSSAILYVNGKQVTSHDGGYSTWRAEITDVLNDGDNEIVVSVDNAPNGSVYPQRADFTFYGGLYRNVNLILAGSRRFDLDHFGDCGLKITPEVQGKDAKVQVEAFLTGVSGEEQLSFTILDGEEIISRTIIPANAPHAELGIQNVHLWNGRKDPHLYLLQAVLSDGETVLDSRQVRFGCRTFSIDSEKGFFLNGKSYPLHGVARHQDRPEIGNALHPEHHEEDIALIMEMGANTVRLAHYQHDPYFYELCDENGLIVWAEIPYISRHLPDGQENTVSQMTELIWQNYNHPSIVVWGLSNEITMKEKNDPALLENHKVLNDLAHKLDSTRLTTLAAVSTCSMDSDYLRIPDVISYNHYYGWYNGSTDMYGDFFDRFHQKYPKTCIGLSEYGCEALNWHSSNPEAGDYTEEYQAKFHEDVIRQIRERPYLWATHVWNMFDFGADARDEGGEAGQNHKGLVTFDRQYKKDAFYAYKAWLSNDPFVHICGKRYVDRVEDTTKITVYSNLPVVELLVNGEILKKQESGEPFFYFDVPNMGESHLLAKALDSQGNTYTDESLLRKVDTFHEAYRLKETGVVNWLDIETPEGYFSINDKIGDIMTTFRGKILVLRTAVPILKRMKGGKSGEKKSGESEGMDMEGVDIRQVISGYTVKRLVSLLGVLGMEAMTKDEILQMNKKLNKIKKKNANTERRN